MAAEGLLTGKTALITGASGIAAAAATLFTREGCRVVVIDISRDNLQGLEQEVPGIIPVTADLTVPGAPYDVTSQARAALGRIDVLFNVVGISARRYGDGPVHEASDEGWDKALDTNAKTTFSMCREVLKVMLEQGRGSIVNTASVLAYAPNAEHFATHAYAASKGAIIALTKSMASCYAAQGIRVNAVAPGLIETPMSARAQGDENILEYMKVRQPLTGRLGKAEDVAKTALYLASDLASFVTGEVIEVAGGWGVS